MLVDPQPSLNPRLGVGSTVGLVLPGGGARAAYQVGVLRAIADMMPDAPNPFPVIVGTSAGAVSAAVLATEAFRWHRAVDALCRVWSEFHVEQVFKASALNMLRSGLHWGLSLMSGGLLVPPPRALFDNTPLRHLLHRNIRWEHLHTSVNRAARCGPWRCAPPATAPRRPWRSSMARPISRPGTATSGSAAAIN